MEQTGVHWGKSPHAGGHQVSVFQWNSLDEGGWHGWGAPNSAMGVRHGCPLSPMLFGLLFDGLHDHLHLCAPTSGIQLRSGKWVSSLVYADDVVLLSWSTSGLQLLLDSMNHFCVGLGLVIGTTTTEVAVFSGPGTASTWRVGAQVLPQSASFKYLGLIFHESGTMSYALQRLAHSAVGACAQLRAKFRGSCVKIPFP